MSRLVDRFGRAHTYLRISVTDRCNLRCFYCMPAEGIPLKRKSEILTLEEIHRLAKIFVGMGVDKIRLTGGEPLVRKGIDTLIEQLGSIPELKTLAITTNAVLLSERVERLRASNISALNISLDTLRRDRFEQITRRDDFDNVMRAIELVLAADFPSVKLNAVIIAGTNDDELLDFVEFAKDTKLNVRFIEYMPFKDNSWQADSVFAYATMKEVIEQKFELIPLQTEPGAVAKDFAIGGHTGTVSFISSMTDSFCGTCNRLRLTADGSIKSCLFYAPELSLRDAIRDGATDNDVEQLIMQALGQKPEAHPPMEELALADNRAMVEIGG